MYELSLRPGTETYPAKIVHGVERSKSDGSVNWDDFNVGRN